MVQLFQAGQRHSKHYLDLLMSAGRLFVKDDYGARKASELFRDERENIKLGQSWAEAGMVEDIIAAELCLKYPVAAVDALDMWLHPKEYQCWLQSGISACKILKRPTERANRYQST